MKREMSYETMDWEAEAKRLGAAFSVKEPFSIVYFSDEGLECWRPETNQEIETQDGHFFFVEYDDSAIYFEFFIQQNLHVNFTWKGKLIRVGGNMDNALPMAEGLFKLGLHSPEVEAALQTNITAHQKLEWTLEYEARYDL